jgi:hypothetical protein
MSHQHPTIGNTPKADESAKTRRRRERGSAGIHSGVFQIVIAAAVWFLAASWLYFAWGTQIDLDLAVATGFFVMFFTLFLMMATGILKGTRRPQQRLSFGKFLSSKVATYTGERRGMDVLIEITLIPVSLAVAATIIGLAWFYLH